jgi:undecaprenyl-diphosphatase
MFMAVSYDFVKSVGPHHHELNIASLTMSGHQWVVLAIGFVVSFFVALGVVAWFMHWVRQRGFVPFAIYRIVLGIGLLTLLMRGVM